MGATRMVAASTAMWGIELPKAVQETHVPGRHLGAHPSQQDSTKRSNTGWPRVLEDSWVHQCPDMGAVLQNASHGDCRCWRTRCWRDLGAGGSPACGRKSPGWAPVGRMLWCGALGPNGKGYLVAPKHVNTQKVSCSTHAGF